MIINSTLVGNVGIDNVDYYDESLACGLAKGSVKFQ